MSRFTLTQYFDETLEIDGKVYQLNFAFDNVLRMFELFSDKDFLPYERIIIAFEMMVGEDDTDVPFDLMDKYLAYCFKEYLGIDITQSTEDLSTDTEKYFDLYEDAERIYAMFIKEYGMDLFQYQGKLHFKKFSALLNQALDRGLSEIVGIRASKVPAPTKYNADERKRLLKLKKVYKLNNIDDPDLIVEKVDNAWDKVANFFRPKGGKADG